jgi:hypothetical protein
MTPTSGLAREQDALVTVRFSTVPSRTPKRPTFCPEPAAIDRLEIVWPSPSKMPPKVGIVVGGGQAGEVEVAA